MKNFKINYKEEHKEFWNNNNNFNKKIKFDNKSMQGNYKIWNNIYKINNNL